MNTGHLRSDVDGHNCGEGHFVKRWFSWSAVIAGALVGIGISFLLNLFNIAIGVTAFRMSSATGVATANDLTPTLVAGGFVALIICAIISMGALGWVAGYIGGLKCISCKTNYHKNCNYGCLYGFTAWCLALIVTIFISAHVGKFLSYSMIALTQPAVAVENYTYEAPQKASVSTHATTTTTQVTVANEETAAKTLALTSFAAFCLFFIGAISACFFGHIAYDRCIRKHT